MKALLFATLLCATPGPQDAEAPAPDERTTAELRDAVIFLGERANLEDVRAIARRRDAEAFEALRAIVERAPREETLSASFAALLEFRGTELAPDVVLWIAETARDEDRARRRAAARGLVGWASEAEHELLRLANESDDSRCRAIAIGGLLPAFVRDRREQDLVLMLAAARLGPTCARAELLEVLTRFDQGVHDKRFERALGDERVSPFVRTVIVDVLFERSAEPLPPTFRAMLRAGDPRVEYRAALHALERRADVAPVRGDVAKLAESADPSVRRASAILLGRVELAKGVDAGGRHVAREARRDVATSRQAAAVLAGELAALAPGRAADVLFDLLADPDRAVATEALRAVERLRVKASIPVLIECLAVAGGQRRIDVARALRGLTGLDHGATAERWRAFWEAEGAEFELPSAAAVRAAEAERERLEASRATQATFYGLPVVSERLAFLLDLSGSMAEPVGESPIDPFTGRPSRTRLVVAKEQLATMLGWLPDETELNVLFFTEEVSGWHDRIVPLSDANRASLDEFVARAFSSGDTNLYAGLETALRDPRIDTLYLLSDGEPTHGATVDAESILVEVERWNSVRHVVIHGVAVGEEGEFLEELAGGTGGRYLLAR